MQKNPSQRILKAIPTPLIQGLKELDWRPFGIPMEFYLEILKSPAQNSAPKIFEPDSHDLHSEPLGLGLAPLWHTKIIYLEILQSRAKIFRAEKF